MPRPSQLPPVLQRRQSVSPALLMVAALTLLGAIGFGFINAQSVPIGGYHRLPTAGLPGGPAKFAGSSVTNTGGGSLIVSANKIAVDYLPVSAAGNAKAAAPVTWDATLIGAADVWNGATGRFTAPHDGLYTVDTGLVLVVPPNTVSRASAPTQYAFSLQLWKKGVLSDTLNSSSGLDSTQKPKGSLQIDLKQGDYLEIHETGAVGIDYCGSLNPCPASGAIGDGAKADNYIKITDLNPPQAAALPKCAAGQFLTTDTSGKPQCVAPSGGSGASTTTPDGVAFGLCPACVPPAQWPAAIAGLGVLVKSPTVMTSIAALGAPMADAITGNVAAALVLTNPDAMNVLTQGAFGVQLWTSAARSSSVIKKQVFTSNGSWTPPANLKYLSVIVVGSGGGALTGGYSHPSGYTSDNFGGGGAAAMAVAIPSSMFPTAAVPITVGAAGSAGSVSGGWGNGWDTYKQIPPGAGNPSSFGGLISAPGGSAGAYPATGGQTGTTTVSGTVQSSTAPNTLLPLGNTALPAQGGAITCFTQVCQTEYPTSTAGAGWASYGAGSQTGAVIVYYIAGL